VVEEFVGAQPRDVVERFFAGLLPSEADALVRAGSEHDLRRALELEPRRADAAVALARMLLARGERNEALELLSNVSGSFQADGLAARIRLQHGGGPPGEVAENDDQLIEAFAALDRGELAPALQRLLDALPAADGRRDDIRRVIVGELDTLGHQHPLARETRRRLASLLY
jgi:putative thioredoxin